MSSKSVGLFDYTCDLCHQMIKGVTRCPQGWHQVGTVADTTIDVCDECIEHILNVWVNSIRFETKQRLLAGGTA